MHAPPKMPSGSLFITEPLSICEQFRHTEIQIHATEKFVEIQVMDSQQPIPVELERATQGEVKQIWPSLVRDGVGWAAGTVSEQSAYSLC